MQAIRHIAAGLGVLLTLPLAGCSDSTTPSKDGQAKVAASALPYTVVAPASLDASRGVPEPEGDVVLTISGAVKQQNAPDALELDMATIEAMGLVAYDVKDPWDNKRVRYTGVLMEDLLRAIGVPSTVKIVSLTALDDYHVEISVDDINRWPVLLATQADGKRMDVEGGGPTRIVFPYDAFPEINRTAYNELWIWNIESMAVR